MRVQDLMTRQLVTTSPGASLKEAARLMMHHKVSGLPVVDESGRLIGVVSETDVAHQESIRRPGSTFLSMFRSTEVKAVVVGDAMTTKLVTVGPAADHAEAARIMESAHVKRLPVVASDGKLLGLISRSDLLKVFARDDQQIVAEIESDVIKRILWLDAKAVAVAAVDGQVSMVGTVPTRSDARILEEMARRIDGVTRIDVSRLDYDVDDSKRAETPLSGGLHKPNW